VLKLWEGLKRNDGISWFHQVTFEVVECIGAFISHNSTSIYVKVSSEEKE